MFLQYLQGFDLIKFLSIHNVWHWFMCKHLVKQGLMSIWTSFPHCNHSSSLYGVLNDLFQIHFICRGLGWRVKSTMGLIVQKCIKKFICGFSRLNLSHQVDIHHIYSSKSPQCFLEQSSSVELQWKYTEGLVTNHLHCTCIMKGSSNGGYEQKEWLWWGEKQFQC